MRLAIFPPLAAALVLAGCGSQDSVTAKNASPADVAAKFAAGQNKPDPGRWRWTSRVEKMDIVGLLPEEREAMGRPNIVFTCVTPEQVGLVHIEAFQKGRDGCTYDHFTMQRGVLDAGLTCTQGGRQDKIAMTGTYSPADYQITTTSRVEIRPGISGEVTKSLEGMRVGECKGTETK